MTSMNGRMNGRMNLDEFGCFGFVLVGYPHSPPPPSPSKVGNTKIVSMGFSRDSKSHRKSEEGIRFPQCPDE